MTQNANDETARQALIKERLNERLQGRTATPEGQQRIPRRSVDGPAPLSPMQRGFWITQQMAPESRAAHRPMALRLTGPLHRPALEQSLNEIVQRHDVLRTAFPAQDGRPVQEVRPPEPLALEVRDLRVLSEREREARARQIARAETQKPFDLTRRPPVRALLLRLSRHQHVLVLLLHHIVFDGWSEGVLRRELAVLYEAFSAGASSPLPELPVQYADVAAWQQQRLDEGALESELRYWKEQLQGGPSALPLPTDRPRPSDPIDRVAKHAFTLPRALRDDLKALGRQEEATLFMTLLAAFKALLYRYTGQTDLVVGTPIAGRSHSEMEPLIGCFMNMLPLRTDLSGTPSFRALLGQVRRMTLSAYDHQALPFERLVEALQPERDPSRPPLFQVLFQLRNLPDAAAQNAGDVRIEPFDFDPGVGGYDLTLEITDAPEGLRCHFKYAPALFEADTIERMAGHFRTLLEAAADDPDRPVTTLPLLTEGERNQLLVEWNDTDAAYPEDASVHELFEAQAAQTPQATALQSGDETLTYRQLNERANRLAHAIRKKGVEPGMMVGLCAARSPEMIIGLLGILKAGAAYLPLDPDYPEERLRFMLDEADVPVLLTQEHLTDALTDALPDPPAKVVKLDRREAVTGEPTANPSVGVAPGDLAYVIYTSGSTGRPKGVMIEHRSVVNFARAAAETYGLEANDRVLQAAPLSFDLSVEEIFITLTSGAALVLRSEAMMDSAHAFVQGCADQALTVLSLPTAFWHELTTALAAGSLALPPSVRLVIVGGEAASTESLARWQASVGAAVRLVNSYGPTETTVIAAQCTLHAGTESAPIGRPLANTQVYVLDEHQNPVPVGVPGELYIGGAGLARGYLGRPALTDERFVASPSFAEGERLYRTGDRVRWRADGTLAFIGRADRQVKIRGFRVEPGEIEAVLGAHPAVRTCAVHVAHPTRGDKQLAAYVVAETACTLDALRQYLRERLPAYMVPSTVTFLEALPKTPAGKVDREALPAPEVKRRSSEETLTAPRTPVEEELAAIWAEVLGLEQVGIHDRFFDIGGHSLLALRVASRVKERLGATVTARTLFEAPTIAQLAPQITTEQIAGEAAMEEMLAEMETLTDEEAERLLRDEAENEAR